VLERHAGGDEFRTDVGQVGSETDAKDQIALGDPVQRGDLMPRINLSLAPIIENMAIKSDT
jgi:hypothetical protein